MQIITGNLLDKFDAGEFDVIIHGCNCFHAMDGGIAAQIKSRYPQAALADSKTGYGAKSKLGWSTAAKVGDDQFIVNAYTQFNPGRDARLKAIKHFFKFFNAFPTMCDKRIGIPAIGCGIGGLSQEHLEAAVASCAPNLDITLVEFG